MTKRRKPAELAKDVEKILRKQRFDHARSPVRDGFPEATVEIAKLVCAGATVSHMATFTNDYRRIMFGRHFIHQDQTLLHLFAGTYPTAVTPADYDTVVDAVRKLTAPNAYTGTTDFDLDHRDDVKGDTPLHLAAKHGSSLMCQVLLEAGANPNILSAGGYNRPPPATPLALALEAGREDIAQVIQSWLAKQAIGAILNQHKLTGIRPGAAGVSR